MTIKYTVALVATLLYGITARAETIPFALVKKAIIVKATVNDVSGYFIVDTGTKGLVLNKKQFKGWPSAEKILDITGKEISLYKTQANFKLGSLNWPRLEADLLPIDHLCKAKGINLLGLIGTSVFSQHILLIDYQKSSLEVIKEKEVGDMLMETYPADVSLDMIIRGGIPIVKMTAGKVPILFGLDTGAAINVLDKEKGREVSKFLTLDHNRRLIGMNAEPQVVPAGAIQNLLVGDFLCPKMNIVLSSLAHLKGSHSKLNLIDGFIGYEFLQHFKVAIHFKKRKIDLYYQNEESRNLMVAR